MIQLDQVFLAKARESLAGAESELANGRYNNCANRSYYACFQAAVCALSRAGIRPSGAGAEWGHAFVQARFAGELISRRKLYPSSLREVLSRTMILRKVADYEPNQVGQTQITRALRSTRELVSVIESRGGEAR